ncbi:MAG: GNAT family N-acetyltransferase [bacterium]|nr:GNAT family N-acetyltransferase [bacterium]
MQSQPESSDRETDTGVATLDAHRGLWNRAAAASTGADAFCCRSEWQVSFHATFAQERRVHLRTTPDSVLAFAERHLPGYPRLFEPLEAHWLFGCPALGPDALELLAEFASQRPAEDVPPALILSGLRPDTQFAAHAVQRLGRIGALAVIASEVLRSASLEGGLDGFLGRRSRRLRRNLRTAARRAGERGVTFERQMPKTPDAADALFDRMLAIERQSWKGIGECGMAEPPSCDFYRELLRRLSLSATSRVVLARRGDTDIGFIFGGLAKTVYRGQQFSFVEEWRDASIGNLLQLEKLRWLTEEGIERYDMGPDMPYKRHWTEIETSALAISLRPGVSGG